MTRWIIIIFGVVIGCVGISYGLGRLFFRVTDGFHYNAVIDEISSDPVWATAPPDPASLEKIQHVINQRFTYLSKGTQSYVFISDDGEYVLKFFKQKHLRMPYFLEWVRELPYVSTLVEAKRERRLAKRYKIFTGCKLAYEEMSEDTGVIYCHLTETDFLPSELQVVDKLGFVHHYNPNQVAFYLQKRGTPLFAYLRQCSDIRQAIESLIAYLVSRSKRGFFDRDPAYAQNLGFIGDRPVTFDVGNLRKDDRIRDPEMYVEAIKVHTQSLKYWLENEYPEIIPFYESCIKDLERNADHEKSNHRPLFTRHDFDVFSHLSHISVSGDGFFTLSGSRG